MGHQNVRLAGEGHRRRRFALKISNDATHDVFNVDRALAQVRIVDLAEGVGVTSGDVSEDCFDVTLVRFEFAQDLVNQCPVFDHEQVRIKNPRVQSADRLGDALLHFQYLHARLDERVLEPCDLSAYLRRVNPVTDNLVVFITNDVNAGMADPWRNADAL